MGKSSSITHWVNGSVTTGQASVAPSAWSTRARSSSVVAGVMRSTMVEGKATSPATQAPSSASRSSAKRDSTRRATTPFAGRLSQVSTVKGGTPAACRRASASMTSPGAVVGSVGVGEVAHDGRVLLVERAGRRIVAIALLGHRQRDDAHPRIGHGGKQALALLHGDEHVDHAADDAQLLALAGAHESV